MAEKNNELLMKNHQAHPIDTKPVFEANAILDDCEDNYKNGRGHGHNRSRRHSRGCGRGYYQGRGHNENHYYQPRGGYKNHKKRKNEEGTSTQHNI